MNNKFVVLIPIAVIAVILSAIIIRFFVMEDKTTPPTNIVEKPKEAVKVEKGVNESKISKISSPPYFVFEGDRVSTLTMVRGQQMTVEVIDEDGDLNGVWNEILPKGVSRYALMLPSTSVTGDSIEINATDQAGHRSVSPLGC